MSRKKIIVLIITAIVGFAFGYVVKDLALDVLLGGSMF